MTDYITKPSDGTDEFETGAHRGSNKGKGRFDLIPWEAINWMFFTSEVSIGCSASPTVLCAQALNCLIDWFYGRGDLARLGMAMNHVYMAEYLTTDEICSLGDYDWNFLKRLADLMERGAVLYGDWNWSKGIKFSRYFDSAVRHLWQYKEGINQEEDHFAAFMFNVACAIHTQVMIDKGTMSASLVDDRPKF